MGRLFDHNASNYMNRGSMNLGLNGDTNCSFAVWINLTAVDVSLEQRVVQKEISDGWSSIRMTFSTNTSRIIWGVESQTGAAWPSIILDNGIGTGSWRRVMCVWNRNLGTQADFLSYVDGEVVSHALTANGYTASFTIEETSNNYYFGIRPVTLASPLDAKLAWVCVWNRALSIQEVKQDYWNPRNVTNGLISRVPIGGSDVDEAFGGNMTVTGTLQDITGGEPIHGYQHRSFQTQLRPRPFAPGLAR